MATSLSSPADVLNDSLKRIGYRLRVADLYDGSDAANHALDIYSQTRDVLQRDGDWQFVERNIVATTLKTAPAGGYFDAAWNPTDYPPLPWKFSYTYPADCLRVRQLKSNGGFLFEPMPLPTLNAVVNDNGYTPPRRVIVGNLENPILVYAGRVTDPTSWPPDFTEALCAALARRLAPVLADLNVARIEAQDEAMSNAVAQAVTG